MHLSSQQEQVLALISAGSTISHAAETAGVHRNTIHNWLRSASAFRLALFTAREAKSVYWRERAEELAPAAVDTIRSLMTDPATPASVRLKAALAMLNIATVPPMESRPVPLLEAEILHNSAQFLPELPASQQVPDVREPPQPEPVHNVAQQPIRRDAPKTGRNDPCPCGSGKKFKRCCLLSLATREAA